MLNSTHTLANPTPTTLERYLLEFESSMSVSFVSEYSRKTILIISFVWAFYLGDFTAVAAAQGQVGE